MKVIHTFFIFFIIYTCESTGVAGGELGTERKGGSSPVTLALSGDPDTNIVNYRDVDITGIKFGEYKPKNGVEINHVVYSSFTLLEVGSFSKLKSAHVCSGTDITLLMITIEANRCEQRKFFECKDSGCSEVCERGFQDKLKSIKDTQESPASPIVDTNNESPAIPPSPENVVEQVLVVDKRLRNLGTFDAANPNIDKMAAITDRFCGINSVSYNFSYLVQQVYYGDYLLWKGGYNEKCSCIDVYSNDKGTILNILVKYYPGKSSISRYYVKNPSRWEETRQNEYYHRLEAMKTRENQEL